jgi:tryptophan-rich sensory protein
MATRTSIAVSAGGYVLLALVGAWLTEIGPWYRALKKPSWQPPDLLFGPAWSTIFTLAAWAAVRGWNAPGTDEQKTVLVAAFVANGLGNMAWSLLFFRWQRPDWALVEVVPFWATIVGMIVAVRPLDRTAVWMLAPYLGWVSFATVLNAAIVRLNRPFGGP